MYRLESSYGYRAYRKWRSYCEEQNVTRSDQFSLDGEKSTPENAELDLWTVTSFEQLLECVAFLTAMNKRHTLYFRGQSGPFPTKPTLFRDTWRCFDSSDRFRIAEKRTEFFDELHNIAKHVAEICITGQFKTPRWRDLTDVPEAPWAIVQHYELWPTPLIDITTSVNVAAAFALGMPEQSEKKREEGHLYVAALPYSSEGTTISVAERLMLSRLITTCPPLAQRPHLQNGFLVGRYPMRRDDATSHSYMELASLSRRLVAHFVLKDGEPRFWSETFPAIRESAVLPSATNDPLLEKFKAIFGKGGDYDLHAKALELGAKIIPRPGGGRP